MDSVISLSLLLGFGFITGIRHGVDVDHIAAIGDITSSQSSRTRGLYYATLYAIGHGVMVVLLGLFLLVVGQAIPKSVDSIFGKIVGGTLLILGLYVLISLARQRSNFRMKSRWMLIFDAIQFGYHKLLHNFKLSHEHPRLKEERYAPGTAFGIGVIHGVGAETPTQIAALAALIGIGGGTIGILFLLLFVLGIFLSNFAIAWFSSVGFLKAKQQSKLFMLIGSLTAVFSLVVGVLFLTG